LQQDGGVRTCERNSPADTRVMKKERKEVLQALEQRFPCSLWRRQW